MRTITLILPDDQFVELYSFSKGYLAANETESAFTDLMQNVHSECDKEATDHEREVITAQIEAMKQVFTEDSPDKYLMQAGFNGLIEKAADSL